MLRPLSVRRPRSRLPSRTDFLQSLRNHLRSRLLIWHLDHQARCLQSLTGINGYATRAAARATGFRYPGRKPPSVVRARARPGSRQPRSRICCICRSSTCKQRPVESGSKLQQRHLRLWHTSRRLPWVSQSACTDWSWRRITTASRAALCRPAPSKAARFVWIPRYTRPL